MATDIAVNSSSPLSDTLGFGQFILEDLSLSEITDLIYSWCFDHLTHDSIVNAQQEFQHLTGKFFSDDDFYKVRIKYFIEYFLFDRLEKFDFLNHLTCPIYAFYQSQPFRTLPKHVLHFVLELRNSHHSLFQVESVNSDELQILDLLSPNRQKISIAASKNQVFAGIEKSDIFQCHIFKIDHTNWISDGLILHSRKARKTLLELANEYNNNNKLTHLQFLFQLANGQLMMVRRQSVSAMYAYQSLK
jgi:hypothetical protein